jgi:hypothetical protein
MAGMFREFYPRPDRSTPLEVQTHITELVEAKFPGEFDPTTGVVTLAEPTPVRPERFDPSAESRDDSLVRYFAQVNPGYRNGNFLACVTRLARENLTPLGRRLLGER